MTVRESFPASVDFQTPHTRMEFQGNLISCICFGLTSSLEAIADRAGQPVQLSPLFLWGYRNPYAMHVESMVQVLNRVSTCRDDLWPYIVAEDYPYTVANADVTPSAAAFASAAELNIRGIELKRIAGKTEIMRALATGSPLVTIRQMGGGYEHCECIIGYSDAGAKFHGSGSDIYIEPWESFTNGVITQVYKYVKAPWPLVPHPDYVEGDLPTFADGTLTCPTLWNVPPWPGEWTAYYNVVVNFDGGVLGNVTWDDPDISGYDPMWKPATKMLLLPTLMFAGKRYSNVRVSGPAVQIISHTIEP